MVLKGQNGVPIIMEQCRTIFRQMGVLSAKSLSIIEWFSHDNVDTPDLTHWIKVQTC